MTDIRARETSIARKGAADPVEIDEGGEFDPAEEPCPEHRQPLGRCPARCLVEYGTKPAERTEEHARALALSRSDLEALRFAISCVGTERAAALEAILSDLLSDATGDDFTLSEEV